MQPRMSPIGVTAAVLLAAGAALSFGITAAGAQGPVRSESEARRSVAPSAHRAAIASVTSWAYQLQKLNPAVLAQSPYDMLVIDHAPDRVESVEQFFRKADVAALKVKPDGSRRLVLAYMSIGEAERYRFYWDDAWLIAPNCPSWLGPVNPQWVGNYPVRFWDPDWQVKIFGASDSYLDRVLEAGFDGVYLDRADVYEEFKTRPTARADMISFLTRLADHARAINPASVIVLQNAEELLADRGLRSRLDGAAKESLYYDADKHGAPAKADDLASSMASLKLLAKSGGRVFAVEYLDTAAQARQAKELAVRDQILPYFAERSLSSLNLLGSDQPAPTAPPQQTLINGQPDPQLVPVSPCS